MATHLTEGIKAPAFKGKDQNGNAISLSDYKGKKLLIVNVASNCGFTPQYKDLQALYETNKDKLTIIGFPCNQFLFQESKSEEKIESFCQLNYQSRELNNSFGYLIFQDFYNRVG